MNPSTNQVDPGSGYQGCQARLRLTWEPGTIAMRYNELTQHYLVFDRSHPRVMHRVIAS